jgi:hypothetical protein
MLGKGISIFRSFASQFGLLKRYLFEQDNILLKLIWYCLLFKGCFKCSSILEKN